MNKRILLTVLIASVPFLARSQAVLLSENFDNYNGLVSSIPAGFTITWNDTAANSRSYYFTSTYCGQSCNAYKFGVDSATMITPAFSNPGSVSFYLKGNGTYEPNNFRIYESPNGSTWNLVSHIDSIPAAAQTVNLALSPSTIQLTFYFQKDNLGYNAGFDDLVIYGSTGLNENPELKEIAVYPAPAATEMTIDFGPAVYSDVNIYLANIVGQMVFRHTLPRFTGRYHMNVTDFPDGIYLLKINAGYQEIVKRVVLKK